MPLNPQSIADAMMLYTLVRQSLLDGPDDEAERVLGHRMPNGDCVTYTITGSRERPIPVVRHVPLLDALIDEAEQTGCNTIPVRRVAELMDLSAVPYDEIGRLAVLICFTWRGAGTSSTAFFPALRGYQAPSRRIGTISCPAAASGQNSHSRGSQPGEMEAGVVFSQEMLDFWHGRYKF